MSRRRRSGWDGFASSRSWNTVRMPNTFPSTAKLPTAATAAPPALSAAAPPTTGPPGESAEKDVRGHPHRRAVHGPGHDRDDRGHDERDLCVQEDRYEDGDGSKRQDARQGGATSRPLQGKRRQNQEGAGGGEEVAAV